MKFQCFIAICLIAFHQATAFSQGRKADYERSESLDRRVADKVTREQIQPAWRPDGTFWYRVKTDPGQSWEWVNIDPARATREVVIDSAQLKNAIEKVTENKPSGNMIDDLAPVKNSGTVFA